MTRKPASLRPAPDDFVIFLSEKALSKTTEYQYTWMMGHLLEWMKKHDENLTWQSLTFREIKEFLAEKKWGNSMQRHLNFCLGPYLKWKFGEHSLSKWRVKRKVAPPQRTMNEKQIQQLINAFQPGICGTNYNSQHKYWLTDLARPTGIRNFALIWMLLDTGFRANEVCSLQIPNIDLKGRRAVAEVKGGKWRTAFFTEQTAQAISNWLEVRKKIVTAKSGNYLFIALHKQHKGKPLTTIGLRILCRRLGKRSGVGPLSPHDFRRSFATLAARHGASLRAIQEGGGWSNPEMVFHYTRAIQASEVIPFLAGNLITHDENQPRPVELQAKASPAAKANRK